MSRIEEVLRRAGRENLAAPDAADGAERATRSDTGLLTESEAWGFDAVPETISTPHVSLFAETAEPAVETMSPPLEFRSSAEPTLSPAAPLPVLAPADVLITRTLRMDAIEQYRKLGAALHEAQLERGLRSILCTSALMGEGKTVTASNLALTLSESYRRRVLLIDADLRRPQIHAMFGIPNLNGLCDALAAPEDTKLAIQQVTARLSIVTAGVVSSDPMSGLTSSRLRQLIEEARNKFDWVIVDTPPVLLLPDARVLVSTVDAVLLVVRANTTPYRTVLRAVDVIKRERIFGTVLNSVDEAALGSDYGGYEGYYAAVRPA